MTGDDQPPFEDPQEPKQDFAPREDTRAIIMSAGIHRQAARNRRITLGIVGVLALAVIVVGLDAAGVVQLLPEKMVPTLIGPEDETGEPAPRTAGEPSELRDKLLGLNQEPEPAPTEPSVPSAAPTKDLSARSLFEDAEKSPSKLSLNARAVRAQVALPDGLTGEAIAQVIQDNSGGARLCIAEAMKAGETKGGKAEFDVTIAANGTVEAVTTRSGGGSRLSACMEKTIKRWRFPTFEGEPVVVVIPYVITPGI